MDKLPYEFDLLYDIKYQYELVREYVDAKRRYLGIKSLCRHYGIPLPHGESQTPEPEFQCPKCGDQMQMFTADLDICKSCGHQRP